MSLRALFAACVMAVASIGAAADYDLVVPKGWDYLKSAKALVVYSPSGAIKAGDQISRIVVGGADGPGVSVSAGWESTKGEILGAAGSVDGFAGNVVLSTDPALANGLTATLVPAGAGATRPAEDGITGAFPWIWVIGALGVIVVAYGASVLLRKGPEPAAPQRFTGRKGIEEGVREIRSKIDEIQNAQEQLVRKPPVLRSFRKQIETFEHRLRDIEHSSGETSKQLSAISGALQRMEERLGNLAQHAVNASTDSKKAVEIIAKVAGEQSARADKLEEQIKRVASGQEGLSLISRDVAKSAESIANLGSRIDSVAAQHHAQENRIQSVATGVDAVRKQVEQVEHRLSEATQAHVATQTSLARLATLAQNTEEKLSALSSESKAGQQRHEEAKSRFAGVESSLSAVDARLEVLARGTDALQHSLSEIQGRVTTTEGSLAANLQGLASQLDTRLDTVTRATDALQNELKEIVGKVSNSEGALAANLQGLASQLESKLETVAKATDALKEDLSDIQGKVTNSEGAIAANLQGLASELGTLKSEVGNLPGAMSSLGERVGSLDARLAPISERGDLLAESFKSLQARFEDASKSLAQQVNSLDTRLDEIKTDGSKLANLPEVALELHGNTAELAEHVRSAESGLRSLGEELAKLQQAMLSDNKQSDVLAEELTQRLAAWEGALAGVASQVEELRKPAEEDEVDGEEVRAKPVAKGKAKKAAADLDREPEPEPEQEVVAEPVLVLEESNPVQEVPAVEEAPAPVLEVVQPAAQVVEEEEADEVDTNVFERGKAGRWVAAGGSCERHWSVRMPSAKALPSVKGPIRPLTPIETPGVDNQLGALICTGQGAAYAHGDSLCSFWPGSESRSVALQSPVPADSWRLMLFGGYLFCAEERQVEVIHLGTWSKHGSFQGDYLEQGHTEHYWAGLMAWGEKLAVDFRDATGKHVETPRELDAPAGQPYHFAASGNSVYVASRNGSVFRVEPGNTVQLCRPMVDDKVISLTVTKAGVLLLIQTDSGVVARLVGKEGHLLKETQLGNQVVAHPPVVMGERFYVFDDCVGELLTVNLKSLQVVARVALESTLSVGRMIGLAAGKTHLLAILAADDRGNSTRAFVLDPKTGQEMTLCPINHPRAEMVAGDGHLIVATSSPYQNTIQVFDPFEAVELKAKRAA